MNTPFVVGNTYRNRDGEYEVIGLDGPFMRIRYADGSEEQTNITLQARILANIRAALPPRPLPAIQPPPPPSRQPRSSSRRAQFAGLQENDFQRGITGTTWRARPSLGGLLRQDLSIGAERRFESYPVPRLPQVHIAQPEHYRSGSERSRDAKFIFTLSPESAYYGFYIEKNDGPMGGTWRWPNLLAALQADESLDAEILAAMRCLGLQWEMNIDSRANLCTRVTAGEHGLIWRSEEGAEEPITWPEFVCRLSQLDEGQWCNLYLGAYLPKAEAIARGGHIAHDAVAVYRNLLPLYDAATIQPSSSV